MGLLKPTSEGIQAVQVGLFVPLEKTLIQINDLLFNMSFMAGKEDTKLSGPHHS